MVKVIIIGLDGASWSLLNILIKKGIMLTLGKLIKRGVYGELESTIPPVTGPAWASFASGKNPAKQGIFDFIIPDKNLSDLKTITSNDIKEITFYEILNLSGLSSILINLPVSYPPKTNDIIITSLLTKGENFVFPKHLKEEIKDLEEYRITPDMSLRQTSKTNGHVDYVNDIRTLEKNRFNVAKTLFETKKWDLFFVLFSGTDWIQHMFFDKLISDNLQENNPQIRLYKELDNYISYFVKNLPSNCYIILMSDHGFYNYSGSFYMNKWLEKQGYLKIKNSPQKRVYQHRFIEELDKTDDNNYIKLKIPINLLKMISTFKLNQIFKKLKSYIQIKIEINMIPDISNSIAYMISNESCGIYLNSVDRFDDGIISKNNYEEVRKKIYNELEKLELNGKKILKHVWLKEEIYSGPLIDKAPDILFLPNSHWPSTSLFSPKIFDTKPINNHDLQGIFLAYGPDIKKGKNINAKIFDIVPTILHIFDLSIPNDMDGKVLAKIFEEKSDFVKRNKKYVDYKFYKKQQEFKHLKKAIKNIKIKENLNKSS